LGSPTHKLREDYFAVGLEGRIREEIPDIAGHSSYNRRENILEDHFEEANKHAAY